VDQQPRRNQKRLYRYPMHRVVAGGKPRNRWLTTPAYRVVLDPDGRPLGMRLRRSY
jgi:hypothetical protein